MAPLITKNFWLSSRLILLAQRALRSYPIFSAQKKYFIHLWNKEGKISIFELFHSKTRLGWKAKDTVHLELQKGTINSKYLCGFFCFCFLFFILRVFHNELRSLPKSEGNLQFHRYINEGRFADLPKTKLKKEGRKMGEKPPKKPPKTTTPKVAGYDLGVWALRAEFNPHPGQI